jgi:phage terminase large subunit
VTDLSTAFENLRRWRERPDVMVRELFGVTPDAWQDEALQAFPSSPRLALKACKGPGKTAVLAWIGWNFLLTRPHPRCGATSISGDNLKANLWTELALWRSKSKLLDAAFEQTATAIFARDHPETWKLEARTWARDANQEQIGRALAGLHAPYVLWLLDESGGYPEAILPTAEAIFSGSPEEAHVVQAGNPLQLAGPLYRACNIARALWKVIEITGDPDSPKRSPRIPIEYAREQIRQYGRDNPFVLVNIFGEFPPSALNALLGIEEVLAAQRRQILPQDVAHAARILGVDVARFGDDSSVIFPRQGLAALKPLQLRNLDASTGAGAVARKWLDFGADACFVDESGGYGAGWIDCLRQLGHAPIGIQFAGEPSDRRYLNKRAEMYFEMAAWVKSGGALPDVPEMVAELTQTTYTFKGDRLMLEPKEQVKVKLGRSPDYSDALALTFAQPVVPMRRDALPFAAGRYEAEHDPFKQAWQPEREPQLGGTQSWMRGRGY